MRGLGIFDSGVIVRLRGCSDQSEGGHGSLHQARRAEVLTLKRQILCFWHSVAFPAASLSDLSDCEFLVRSDPQ